MKLYIIREVIRNGRNVFFIIKDIKSIELILNNLKNVVIIIKWFF